MCMKNPNVPNKQLIYLFAYCVNPKPQHQHYFESDYTVVANELIHNDDDIHIQGIFKENNDTVLFVNMLNLSDDYLQKLIQETQNNTHEPMLYQLTRNKEPTL